MSQANSRTEYYDGTFTHVVMAYSGTAELLILGFDRGFSGNVVHILYWDWYAEDYYERFVNLSDIHLSQRPAGFHQPLWQGAGVQG
jgi:hypothetical protein